MDGFSAISSLTGKTIGFDFSSNADAVNGVIYVGSSNSAQIVAIKGTCSSEFEGKQITISSPAGPLSTDCKNGTWSSVIDMSGQPEGTTKVVVKASDGEEIEIPIVKDVTAPVLSLADGLLGTPVSQTNQQAYFVSGACSDEGSPVTIKVGGVVLGNPLCTNKTFSKSLDLSSLADGSFTVTIEQKDIANNIGNYNFSGFLKDTSGNPLVVGLSNDSTPANLKNLTWSCNKACSYRYVINTSASHVFTSESFSATASAAYSGTAGDDGQTYYIHVQAKDNTNTLSSTVSVSFIIDRVAPSISGLASDGTATNSKSWNWSCSESCTYRSVVNTNPSFTFAAEAFNSTSSASQTSGNGTYYLYVQAKDSAGNLSAPIQVSAVLDTTAPVVLGLADDATWSPSKTWTWSCSEACTYRYIVNSLAISSFTNEPLGATTTTDHSAGTGVVYLHVQAQDSVGNYSAVVTVSAKVDADIPVVLGLASDATPANSKVWSWSCGESCTYRSVVDTSPTYTFTSEAFDSTTTASQATGAGTYYLHVQAKDQAGNLSTTVHVSAVIDAVAPIVSGLSDDTAWKTSKTWNWSCSKSCTYRYVVNSSATHSFSSESFVATTSTVHNVGSGVVYLHVQAQDTVSNTSAVVTVSAKVDAEAPTAPSALSLGDTESNLIVSPVLTFTEGSDAGSGLQKTETRIVKSSDGTEIVGWSTITSGATLAGTFINNETYKFQIRSVDNLALTSSVVESGVWTAKNNDPYWSNVKMLLSCEGGAIREYITNQPINAGVQVSSAKAKFGTQSCYFDGVSAYLDVTNSAFAVGTNDFTLEAWVYDLNGAYGGIVGSAYRLSGQTTGIHIDKDYGLIGDMQGGSTIIPSPKITSAVWQHVALVRSSGFLKYYIDGVSVASGTIATSVGSTIFSFGRVSPNAIQYPWNGYIDEARFTANVARYTSNFTPPTTPFPVMTTSTVPDPLGIEGAALWLDASDSSTVTSSAGVVSQWTDKSFGRVFSQATEVKKPLLDTSMTRLPLNSIKFDSGSKHLFSTTSQGLALEHTVFMAGYWTSPNSYNGLMLQGGQSTGTLQSGVNTGYVGIIGSSGYNDTIQTAYGNAKYAYKDSAAFNDMGRFMLTTVSSGTTYSTHVFKLNGVDFAPSGSAGSVTVYALDTIGSSDTLYQSAGNFGEIIVYNRKLTPAEISQVEAYLKAKWSTP